MSTTDPVVPTDARSAQSWQSTLAEIAHRLAKRPARAIRPGADDLLCRLTQAAVAGVPGADYAGLTLREQGRLISRGPSHPQITDVDQLQVTYDEGPCVDAIHTGTGTEAGNGAGAGATILVTDFSTETRWPRFRPAAVEGGIASLVSVALAPQPGGPGALNLYSTRRHAFDATSQAIAAALALQAAIVLDDAHTIGQAKGILIGRFGIDPDQAFALLVKLSQETNTKLAEVAHHLVTDTTARARTTPPQS